MFVNKRSGRLEQAVYCYLSFPDFFLYICKSNEKNFKKKERKDYAFLNNFSIFVENLLQ